MNYDEYGFPIFDDEWDDTLAFPQKTVRVEEPVKDIANTDIKLENKPKNTGLF